MKSKVIPTLLGAVAGALLAGAAVFAAYRGNLAIAGIMIVSQAVAFVIFVLTIASKRRASRALSDS
jgi:hypothetical protein